MKTTFGQKRVHSLQVYVYDIKQFGGTKMIDIYDDTAYANRVKKCYELHRRYVDLITGEC